MCGRYSLIADLGELARQFEFDGDWLTFESAYNIAPTQEVLTVVGGDARRGGFMRWGLIPHWAKNASIGSRMINARAETVAEKPVFRDALRRRRCLVLADGFYEWQRTGGARRPMRVVMRSGEPFAFAGLWSVWTDPDGKAYTHLVCSNRKEDKEACDGPWVPAGEFEPRAMTAILEDVLAEDNVTGAIRELRAESGDDHDKTLRRLDSVGKRLEEVGAREKRLYRAFEGGQIEYPVYAERNRELREMKEAVEAERRLALESAGARMVVLEDPEAVLRYAGEISRFLRMKEPSRRRSWLRSFIRCIWIHRGQGPNERARATIVYTIPTPPGTEASGTTTRPLGLPGDVLPSTRVGSVMRARRSPWNWPAGSATAVCGRVVNPAAVDRVAWAGLR